MEKTHFELRGFFVNKINDAYNKNIRIDNRACTYSDVDIRQKFKYSMKNKLLSFISEIKESSMMVSVDIMKELRMLAGIENITGLKDIGFQIGFNYQNIRVNGKRMRVLVGKKEDFMSFVDMVLEGQP